MTHVVARIVTDAPPRHWSEPLIELWSCLRRVVSKASLTWKAELLARGEATEKSVSITETGWNRLLDRIRKHEISRTLIRAHNQSRFESAAIKVTLAAEFYTQFCPFFEPRELSHRLFDGLPSVLESDRQPRVLTISLASDLISHDSLSLEELQGGCIKLSQAADACWAQFGLEEHPPGPFRPAKREWREWAPLVKKEAPAAASIIILGQGHVAALGGRRKVEAVLRGFRLRWLASHGGSEKLLVQVTADPVCDKSTEVRDLEQALTPILMTPPLDPVPVLVVLRGTLRRSLPQTLREGIQTRTLEDGTLVIEVMNAPIRRGDAEQSSLLAHHLRLAYAMIPNIEEFGQYTGSSLYLPRFLGNKNYIRLGTTGRLTGLPVWDTGEPFGSRLTVSIFTTGPLTKSPRTNFQTALARWAMLVGSADLPRIDWGFDQGRFDVSRALTSGDTLLLLLLDFDNVARKLSHPDVIGIVLGPPLSEAELLRRWNSGEQPFHPK